MFEPELLIKAQKLLDICKEQNIKIVTAESCTGGLLAGLFTEIAGSSAVFDRGFITYSNQAKHDLLGVDQELLDDYGAVSRQVAGEMAQGALQKSSADLAFAVTGIAGPGGATENKPIGLVYIGIAFKAEIKVQEFIFSAMNRSQVRLATLNAALDLAYTSVFAD